jgi:hypothetical protein
MICKDAAPAQKSRGFMNPNAAELWRFPRWTLAVLAGLPSTLAIFNHTYIPSFSTLSSNRWRDAGRDAANAAVSLPVYFAFHDLFMRWSISAHCHSWCCGHCLPIRRLRACSERHSLVFFRVQGLFHFMPRLWCRAAVIRDICLAQAQSHEPGDDSFCVAPAVVHRWRNIACMYRRTGTASSGF